MQELRTTIVARLKDPSNGLYPTVVTGGIFDRRLARGNGPGATPEAFAVMPGDLARVPILRPSIVVSSPNEVEPPDGPVDTGDVTVLRHGFLRLAYYVPATAPGKVTLDTIDARVRQLLHRWQTTLMDGYPVTLSVLEMTEAVDSEEFPGSLQAIRRVVGEYLRPAV